MPGRVSPATRAVSPPGPPPITPLPPPPPSPARYTPSPAKASSPAPAQFTPPAPPATQGLVGKLQQALSGKAKPQLNLLANVPPQPNGAPRAENPFLSPRDAEDPFKSPADRRPPSLPAPSPRLDLLHLSGVQSIDPANAHAQWNMGPRRQTQLVVPDSRPTSSAVPHDGTSDAPPASPSVYSTYSKSSRRSPTAPSVSDDPFWAPVLDDNRRPLYPQNLTRSSPTADPFSDVQIRTPNPFDDSNSTAGRSGYSGNFGFAV
ncbi:hypothetical protein HDZ31DRAFT_77120 [Schizophyllum fasciatum]